MGKRIDRDQYKRELEERVNQIGNSITRLLRYMDKQHYNLTEYDLGKIIEYLNNQTHCVDILGKGIIKGSKKTDFSLETVGK